MNPIIETAQGRVEGVVRDGVASFRGVPYGASTAGEGRFAPPAPPQSWTGVRSAHDFGPICPQVRPSGSAASEDCLVLNVWTPAPEGRRPVLVWFHGGGFLAGQGDTRETDGAALARDQDVVVITLNHRLGLLGFLDLESISDERFAHAKNAGMLDLVAALRWVRDNIAAFGGDPDSVTVFGHSGGGGKVSAMLAMPAARGLFHRAMVLGGPPFGIKTRDETARTAHLVLSQLGLDPSSAERIFEVPVAQLLEAQDALGAGAIPSEHGTRFSPVVGGEDLPVDPYTALAAGMSADIPVIAGTARDEAHAAFFALERYRSGRWQPTLDELVTLITPGLSNPADAGPLIDRYLAHSPRMSRAEVFLTICSDQFRVRTARLVDARLAGGAPHTFVYSAEIAHGSLPGAYHGVEVPFFFGTMGADTKIGPTAERSQLGAQVTAAVGSFARHGTPGEGWPAYDPASRREAVLRDDGIIHDVPGYSDDLRALWQGIPLGVDTDPWTTLYR